MPKALGGRAGPSPRAVAGEHTRASSIRVFALSSRSAVTRLCLPQGACRGSRRPSPSPICPGPAFAPFSPPGTCARPRWTFAFLHV